MTAMLNEFSLEKIEQGQLVRTPVEIDIVHLCIELIEELRPRPSGGES